MLELVYRNLQLEVGDDAAEIIPATLSTEYPVDRGDYVEVLSHSRDAVDLSRFPLPVIESHDGTRLNVGVAENPRVESGRLRADIRFGSSARGREILADVQNGVIRSLSIGYLIAEFDTSGNTLTATRWLPYECSCVSVPADPNAGFYRGSSNMEQKDTSPSVSGGMNRRQTAEKERIDAIRRLAAEYGEHELATIYIADGGTAAEFAEALLYNVANSSGTVRCVEPGGPNEIGLTRRERNQFSIVRAIRAQMPNASARDRDAARFEIECSDAAQKQYGREAQGILVPDDVLFAPGRQELKRDLTQGTATAGGHTVATELLSESFIEKLRNAVAVEQAGARVLTGLQGNIAIPRQTSASTTYWVAENAAITESQQAFDQVTMSPSTVGAFTDYSRRLLLQSAMDVESFVRDDLARTIAVEIDRVAIEGDPDTTATQYEPRGILNVSGIGSVAAGTNGAALTRDDCVDLINEVAQDNVSLADAAFLTNSQVITALQKLNVDTGSGKFVMESRDQLLAFPVFESNNVPSDLTKGSGSNLSALIFGKFDNFIFGYWSGVDILVDPYTGSSAGTVRVVALVDVDTAARHAESFAAITDAVA